MESTNHSMYILRYFATYNGTKGIAIKYQEPKIKQPESQKENWKRVERKSSQKINLERGHYIKYEH